LCYANEREQKNLRAKCKNKSRIEATIAEAFILEENSNFTTKYFGENIHTVDNPVPRYNNGCENDCLLSLFIGRGGTSCRGDIKVLLNEEWLSAMIYVLTNLQEVQNYIRYSKMF
jgi:hypothetical protein